MAETTDVLIIGAGPTGLTMANVLVRSGVNVRILDKKAGPALESRALVVHAKTLELLNRIDLAEKALEEGERLEEMQLLVNGKKAGRLSFLARNQSASTPYPFALVFGQDQTEHLMIQSLKETGVQIEWNMHLLNLEQNSDGVHAQVQTPDGGEETIHARWVVGADGAHSAVRRSLSLGFTGRNYEQTLFVADLDLIWDMEPRQGGIDLVNQGFFLFIPMHGDGRFRLFGTLPPELAQKETLTHEDIQELINAQSGMKVTILKARWISIYQTHLRIAEQFRVNRVFLAGDAAHIHSPAGGQGMNTGIGDAYNLAWKLALVVKGQAHETLLDSYGAERIPFARAILNGSDRVFHLMISKDPNARKLKLLMIPKIFQVVSSLPFLRQQAFWLVSQLWTNYRNSPAITQSEQVKKGPRAGDRAPYGLFETDPDKGKDLFTLINGLDHHLLLFSGYEQSTRLAYPQELEVRVQSLLDRYNVPIHLHTIAPENHSLHKLYGADKPEVFLVRPDGHIAYRGSAQDLDNLTSFLDRLFIQRQDTVSGLIPEQTFAPEARTVAAIGPLQSPFQNLKMGD